MNTFSRAADVKENDDYLQYTPEYEDEKITLLGENLHDNRTSK